MGFVQGYWVLFVVVLFLLVFLHVLVVCLVSIRHLPPGWVVSGLNVSCFLLTSDLRKILRLVCSWLTTRYLNGLECCSPSSNINLNISILSPQFINWHCQSLVKYSVYHPAPLVMYQRLVEFIVLACWSTHQTALSLSHLQYIGKQNWVRDDLSFFQDRLAEVSELPFEIMNGIRLSQLKYHLFS